MKSITTALLYFLSGTGNTYRVACWIKDFFNAKEIETSLKSIEHAEFQYDFRDASQQLTMVLFPTHGFMPPWSMIKFLFRMPRQKRAPVLIVATRGAYRIGPITIPGAAGFANYFAALVLLLKGYDIRGFFSIDMAANLNNLHPSLSHGSLRKISEKSKNRAHRFIVPIMMGKRILFTLNNLYDAIWAGLLFWLIPIFPILYLVYGKTSMAKMMFSNNRCVSCGMCSKICPNKAIEMKRFLGKKRPFWTYHCENCMRCMGYCKKKAVEAGHSLAILQYLVLTTVVLAKVISWQTTSTGFLFENKNYWVMVMVESLYYVPALFISYWIFWMLIRIPMVNTFFSLTTLTHYFKRFHEPETRIKDLIKRETHNNTVLSPGAEKHTTD